MALLLLGAAGCSGELFLGEADDGGSGGIDGGRDLAGRGDGGPGDLRAGCSGVTCGAHARCDAGTGRCACEPGFDGDPGAGCSPRLPCGMCPRFAHCDPGSRTCACDPGYQQGGGQCVAAPIVDPGRRSPSEVCAAWRRGRVTVDPSPWKAGPSRCDPGSMSRAGLDDTLRRIDLFRWLGGLYPVVDDAGWNARDQQCAVMLAANGSLNHMPPMGWQCWTQDAYAAASTSNLAAGVGNAADSIDLYMADSGVPSLGHRRWVMNPPLNRVGIGYASGFSCLHVFDGGNQPSPLRWQAVPNPGPVPLPLAQYAAWSIHGLFASMQTTVQVRRVDDGADLPVKLQQLPLGYGGEAIGFARMGWNVEAGRTYRVQVTGVAIGNLSYDVQPIACP